MPIVQSISGLPRFLDERARQWLKDPAVWFFRWWFFLSEPREIPPSVMRLVTEGASGFAQIFERLSELAETLGPAAVAQITEGWLLRAGEGELEDIVLLSFLDDAAAAEYCKVRNLTRKHVLLGLVETRHDIGIFRWPILSDQPGDKRLGALEWEEYAKAGDRYAQSGIVL